mmetsp:Transcript_42062/g.98557  ORF Transcript_42062/g.98557 Transcript_42062/m.98557 type:complete len:269 (+) Transcript_42062:81-887(+)
MFRSETSSGAFSVASSARFERFAGSAGAAASDDGRRGYFPKSSRGHPLKSEGRCGRRIFLYRGGRDVRCRARRLLRRRLELPRRRGVRRRAVVVVLEFRPERRGGCGSGVGRNVPSARRRRKFSPLPTTKKEATQGPEPAPRLGVRRREILRLAGAADVRSAPPGELFLESAAPLCAGNRRRRPHSSVGRRCGGGAGRRAGVRTHRCGGFFHRTDMPGSDRTDADGGSAPCRRRCVRTGEPERRRGGLRKRSGPALSVRPRGGTGVSS